jgi:hypothetical protein
MQTTIRAETTPLVVAWGREKLRDILDDLRWWSGFAADTDRILIEYDTDESRYRILVNPSLFDRVLPF